MESSVPGVEVPKPAYPAEPPCLMMKAEREEVAKLSLVVVARKNVPPTLQSAQSPLPNALSRIPIWQPEEVATVSVNCGPTPAAFVVVPIRNPPLPGKMKLRGRPYVICRSLLPSSNIFHVTPFAPRSPKTSFFTVTFPDEALITSGATLLPLAAVADDVATVRLPPF